MKRGGERNSRSLQIFYSDHFGFPLPAGHRFPIDKYRLLRMRVEQDGIVPPATLRAARAATDAELALVHTREYLARVARGALDRHEVRRVGFPWSPQLVERARRSVGATIEAVWAARADGVAINLAGGTHHAGASWGEGYCLFNDAAVAARAFQARGRGRRVLIADCDVHQGNGTAAVFADDPTVFTFELYAEGNFPFRKVPGDAAIALADGTEDAEYLSKLTEGLRAAVREVAPDLAIYLAGADPFRDDRLGRLALTKAGLAERDRLVLQTLRREGIPVVVTMAGGYARNILDTVDIHYRTVRTAAEVRAAHPQPIATGHPRGNT